MMVSDVSRSPSAHASAEGETVDLDVTGVAHGGVFVARHEGRVVFVPDTAPGERVRVRLTDTAKRSFWRGEVLEVLDASPDRVRHVWPAADVSNPPSERPGGADFGHLTLEAQRTLKAQVLSESLQRIGGVDLPVVVEPPHPARGAGGETVATETADGTAWRTRVSLHVDDEGRLGPYAARSHRVVPVEELPLATPALAQTARDLARSGSEPGRWDLVEPADGSVRALYRAAPAPSRGRRSHRAPRSTDGAARERIVERVGGREFGVDAGGFWQVHRLAPQTLTDAVGDALREGGFDPDARHLDLYGGVGLLGAAIADVVGPTVRVVSVESDPRATEHAGENLAEWVGARAETGRVDRWLAQLAESERLRPRDTGVVVLDPPRAGAGRQVVSGIAQLRPDRVVYVACDPAALARDLGLFREHGYATASVRGLDLFPHSHHVEAIAVLTPEGQPGSD